MITLQHCKLNAFTILFSVLSIYSQDSVPITLSCPGQTHTEETIYNPERAKYSTGGSAIPSLKKEDCPFCKKLALHKDQEYLILTRYKHTYIMLCEYPYLNGHILILPLEHHASLTEFSPEARTECITLLAEAITIMNDYFKPEGLNIGINTGKVSGGSVPGHMHIHLLPRKTGDMSFLALIGKTNAIFADIPKMYADLKAKFSALNLETLQTFAVSPSQKDTP